MNKYQERCLFAGLLSFLLVGSAAVAAEFEIGDVFLGVTNGQVRWLKPDGTLVQVLTCATASVFTTGMALDKDMNLYATMFDGGTVSKFDKTGTLLGTFGSGYSGYPESILFDAAGNVYVGSADGDNDIRKFDSNGVLLAQFDVPVENRGSDWIDLAADQCTMYYTSKGKYIWRYDVCNDEVLPPFNAVPLPGSVARAFRLLPCGGILVADAEMIVRLDSCGNVVQTYTAYCHHTWSTLVLDPDGKSFWTSDPPDADVARFDIASGAMITNFSTGTAPLSVYGLTVAGEITAALTPCTNVSISSCCRGCKPNEMGSLLVFPLIDNINARTIVEIANLGKRDVWLQGFMVVHPAGVVPTPESGGFIKEDFSIHLTAKEPLSWNTTQAYNRKDADGITTQLRGYPHMKGFMFVWAVDGKQSGLETRWNHLIGDALILDARRSFSYSAYGHQGLEVIGDRVLNLDDSEYCGAPNELMTQGFAAGLAGTMKGTLTVCALDIDFIKSIQPNFDIDVSVYNQDETFHSRHLSCYQFAQYDLAADLQLHISRIFTPAWQLTATSTNPMWAVFFQSAGPMSWNSGISQRSCPAPTRVVLPPVSP